MQICFLKPPVSLLAFLAVWHYTCLVSTSAQETHPPSSDEILRKFKEYQMHFSATLDGQIRDDIKDTTVAFRLAADGAIARYDLRTSPSTAILIYYNDDNVVLEEETDGTTTKMSGSNFYKQIDSTGITYEDLALRFIWWPKATIIGTENISGRSTWKIELRTRSQHTQYSKVVIWVDKDHGWPIKVEGYDHQEHLIKRFQIISTAEINGSVYCKQLRVETLDPSDSRIKSRVYIELTGASKN